MLEWDSMIVYWWLKGQVTRELVAAFAPSFWGKSNFGVIKVDPYTFRVKYGTPELKKAIFAPHLCSMIPSTSSFQPQMVSFNP